MSISWAALKLFDFITRLVLKFYLKMNVSDYLHLYLKAFRRVADLFCVCYFSLCGIITVCSIQNTQTIGTNPTIGILIMTEALKTGIDEKAIYRVYIIILKDCCQRTPPLRYVYLHYRFKCVTGNTWAAIKRIMCWKKQLNCETEKAKTSPQT